MKLLSAAIIAFVLIFSPALSQEDESADTLRFWQRGGFSQLNFNQLALVNWAQGGENTISGTALFNYFVNYARNDFAWETNLDLGYGLITSEEYGYQKTDDKIDFRTKAGQKAFNDFYYTGLFNLKTQFAPGYSYPDDSTKVSDFFAPAYAILSAGLDWKPSDNFSLYLSPATGRFIIVADRDLANKGAYGVEPAVYDEEGNIIEPGERFTPNFGAYLTAKLLYDIMENITFQSQLDLFNDYTDKDPGERLNIDVNWENNLNMKINKFFSASVFAHLIYDHDIPIPIMEEINGEEVEVGKGPRLQLKELIGIGISYKF